MDATERTQQEPIGAENGEAKSPITIRLPRWVLLVVSGLVLAASAGTAGYFIGYDRGEDRGRSGAFNAGHAAGFSEGLDRGQRSSELSTFDEVFLWSDGYDCGSAIMFDLNWVSQVLDNAQPINSETMVECRQGMPDDDALRERMEARWEDMNRTTGG